MNIIESVSEIGGDLHAREPRGQIGEARVQPIAEAIEEINAANVIIDEIDVITRN